MRAAWLVTLVIFGAACGNGDDDAGISVDAGRDGGDASFVDGGVTSGDSGGPILDAGSDAGADASEAGDAGGPLVAYVGGYGGVITRYAVDESSGALSGPVATTSFGPSPSFLAVNAATTVLYAVDESSPGKVGAYAIAPATGALTFLSAVSSGGDGPPYVGLDRSGAFVFVANYTSGSTEILSVESDGSLGAPTDTRSPGSLAHMMIADPTNHFVYVPCKGSDYVAQFVFDVTSGKLTPNPAAATFKTVSGAGPRHLAFHPDGKHVYLINETNSTLQALSLNASDGTLTSLQTVSSLGAKDDGADAAASTAAEVWVHPSGHWLLASNRGDDSIVAFALDAASGMMTFASRARSGGATPRDFTVSGDFVYAANQGGNDVTTLAFDAATGALSPVASSVKVTTPSFVGLVRLPAP